MNVADVVARQQKTGEAHEGVLAGQRSILDAHHRMSQALRELKEGAKSIAHANDTVAEHLAELTDSIEKLNEAAKRLTALNRSRCAMPYQSTPEVSIDREQEKVLLAKFERLERAGLLQSN